MKEEEAIQKQLCAFIRARYPDVIFTSDLSGVRVPIGLAQKMKMLKSQRGIPDLIIFYPAGGYHGLLIEIKTIEAQIFRQNGVIRSKPHLNEQLAAINQLRDLGYAAYFVRGFFTGRKCIENYMNLGLTAGEQDQRSPASREERPIEYT